MRRIACIICEDDARGIVDSMLREGASYASIAKRIDRAEVTVKRHLERCCEESIRAERLALKERRAELRREEAIEAIEKGKSMPRMLGACSAASEAATLVRLASSIGVTSVRADILPSAIERKHLTRAQLSMILPYRTEVLRHFDRLIANRVARDKITESAARTRAQLGKKYARAIAAQSNA